MSELKAYRVKGVTLGDTHDVYLKSEADKVIADLEESHKMEVEQLLIEIVKLKKEKEYVIEHTAEVINAQERELRHQKYKRCLAMAKVCKLKRIDAADYRIPRRKWDFYDKWLKRWLSLADKFKEAK